MSLNSRSSTKGVAQVLSGTIAAQLLLLLSSPLLTRLFSPEAFGLMALFVAICGLLLPAASGKYEIAMSINKDDAIAVQLCHLSIFVVVGCTLLLLGLVVFAGLFGVMSGSPSSPLQAIGTWLFLLPISFLFGGLTNIGIHWLLRLGSFQLVGAARLVQAISIIVVSLTIGWWVADFRALVLGYLVGFVASASVLAFAMTRRSSSTKTPFTDLSSLWSRAREYRLFPLLNGSSALLLGIKTSLPIMVVSAFYSPLEAGYLALVLRVVSSPLGVISDAFSKVNLSRVGAKRRSGQPFKSEVLHTGSKLALVAFLVCFVGVLASPVLFGALFGDRWLEAGAVAQILVPAFSIRLLATGMSSTLDATNNNQLNASWRVFAVMISCISLIGIAYLDASFYTFIVVYAVTEALLYSAQLFLVWYSARYPK